MNRNKLYTPKEVSKLLEEARIGAYFKGFVACGKHVQKRRDELVEQCSVAATPDLRLEIQDQVNFMNSLLAYLLELSPDIPDYK